MMAASTGAQLLMRVLHACVAASPERSPRPQWLAPHMRPRWLTGVGLTIVTVQELFRRLLVEDHHRVLSEDEKQSVFKRCAGMQMDL